MSSINIDRSSPGVGIASGQFGSYTSGVTEVFIRRPRQAPWLCVDNLDDDAWA